MAKVISLKKEKDVYIAEFDNTIFRPAGGGQPSDKGRVQNSEFFGEMIEVVKEGDKFLHKIICTKGILNVNDEVELVLNEKRRNLLTRMHTAEHLLFKSLQTFIKDLKLDKISLEENESSIFVFSENIMWDNLFKAEELANKIIKEDRKISVHVYTKNDVENISELRIKLDRIKEETVRVTEIENFDLSACSGTHCHTTKEIENVLISGFYTANDGYEIKFKVNVIEELYELSKPARELRKLLSTNDKVVQTVKNLKEENEKIKKQLREIMKASLEGIEHEVINGIKFFKMEFTDYEMEILIKKAGELTNEKSVVVFINKTKKTNQLVITVSKDINYDASLILKDITSRYNGRGGGKKEFSMGSFEGDAKQVFEEIKRIIKIGNY